MSILYAHTLTHMHSLSSDSHTQCMSIVSASVSHPLVSLLMFYDFQKCNLASRKYKLVIPSNQITCSSSPRSHTKSSAFTAKTAIYLVVKNQEKIVEIAKDTPLKLPPMICTRIAKNRAKLLIENAREKRFRMLRFGLIFIFIRALDVFVLYFLYLYFVQQDFIFASSVQHLRLLSLHLTLEFVVFVQQELRILQAIQCVPDRVDIH